MIKLKIILIIFISILSSNIYSQEMEFECKSFAFSSDSCEFSGWKKSNVLITWDTDKSELIIHSTIKQTIKYLDFKILENKNSDFFSINGIDNNKQNVKVLISVWDNKDEIYLILYYSNIQMFYKMILL